MHHFAATRRATIVSVTAMGPFAMTYVNPGGQPAEVGPNNRFVRLTKVLVGIERKKARRNDGRRLPPKRIDRDGMYNRKRQRVRSRPVLSRSLHLR